MSFLWLSGVVWVLVLVGLGFFSIMAAESTGVGFK